MENYEGNAGGTAVYVTLKEYLERIKALERTRTREERRTVPTIIELAQAAEVETNTMSRWINGGITSTNHRVLAAVLNELHRRGFDTSIADILAYRPPT